MKEGEHLREVLSSFEKEEPVKPTTTDTKLSTIEPNSTSDAVLNADSSPPNLEERAATLRGSKNEKIVDKNLEDGRDWSQEELIEFKDKKAEAEAEAEPPLSRGLADHYTIFWQEAAKSWADLYIESTRNLAKVTGNWLDLFSKPWPLGHKTKDNANIE
jgi:hypothetical protein